MIDTLPSPLLHPTPLRLGEISLFLDIDGTLAGFEATPEAVQPLARRTLLLQRLGHALEGRIAAVSGRDLASIDRILEHRVLGAAGVHGLERRRPEGNVLRRAPHPALADARRRAEAFAATTPGVLIEDKGLAFALHYRQAPQARAAVEALAALLAEDGLALQPGEDVVEARTPGVFLL
jgi:trehalose 6-phosphate phosphatase